MAFMHARLLSKNCDFFMGSLGGILLWVVCTGTYRSFLPREVAEDKERLQRNKQQYLLRFHKKSLCDMNYNY